MRCVRIGEPLSEPRRYRAEQNFQPERSPLLPMNYTDVIITSIAGLLQLSVAGHAFRLAGRFGVVRVGWSLFGAFAMLAMVHLIESVKLFARG